MKIHEYQAKELLRKRGVAVPRGGVAFTAEEAVAKARELGTPRVVVKAQIHAGGRGKGGGVKVATGEAEVAQHAKNMLGMQLITHQTGPEGKEVKRLLVEEACDIGSELYLGMVVDRETGRVTVMASREGGVEIEEVASRSPEKILKVAIDPALGLTSYQCRNIAFGLGLDLKVARQAESFMQGLYRVFVEEDCSLAEINPLVITKGGDVLALDAKINLDDNAAFRHPNREELRDLDEEEPTEIEGAKHDLSYIKLDGNIGCMVNGAGLAMSTMDIIKQVGGEPANFLDVGGSADSARVSAAFGLILADPNVKGIFINIFGGILKCDVLAQGIVDAAKNLEVKVPLVVRLEGTNVERGREILSRSELNITSADGMADGAEKIVQAVK